MALTMLANTSRGPTYREDYRSLEPLLPTSMDSRLPSCVKRGKYASRACMDCQRRKVKCSGEQPGPCEQCSQAASTCEYRVGARKKARRRESAPVPRPLSCSEAGSPLAPVSPPRSNGTSHQPQQQLPPRPQPPRRPSNQPSMPPDIESRLARIEETLAAQAIRASHVSNGDEVSPSSGSDWLSSSTGRNGRSALLPNDPETNEGLRGGTSSRSMIAVLDQLVGQVQANPSRDALSHCPFNECGAFPDCCELDILVWTTQMVSRDFEQIRQTLVRYFTYLNPYCKSHGAAPRLILALTDMIRSLSERNSIFPGSTKIFER